MEGQKEYRRRITKLQNNKTNSSETNSVVRIQNKVRVLLQSRNQQVNSRTLVAAADKSTGGADARAADPVKVSRPVTLRIPTVAFKNVLYLSDRFSAKTVCQKCNIPVHVRNTIETRYSKEKYLVVRLLTN